MSIPRIRRVWCVAVSLAFAGVPPAGAGTTCPASAPSRLAEADGLLEQLEGFGRQTRGGSGGPTVYVRRFEDDGPGTLRAACRSPGPRIIRFARDGTIELKSDILVPSRITIDARGRRIVIRGHGLDLTDSKDVILVNLVIEHAADDAIKIRRARNVWVHHCTLRSSADGLIDIVNGSRGVTISWCRFEDHNKVMLIGSGDSRGDTDRAITVTIHHCLFDRTRQRHPRIRFGKVDTYNNYLYRWGLYGMRSACDGQLLMEANIFEAGQDKRGVVYQDWAGFGRAVGNRLLNGARVFSRQPERVFQRPYEARIDPPGDRLRQRLRARAGATLTEQAEQPGSQGRLRRNKR